MDNTGNTQEAQHLCVLVHGLWGNPNHLEVVAKSLRAAYPQEHLHILVAKRNSGSFTYDGIELGGERVCQEIEEEIETLTKNGQEIKRLSLVGYSLGGLVARYAVGLLDSKGVFDNVKPVNFTTFASPHLGVRTPLRGWHNSLWNILGARTLSASGRQLFTIDNFRDTGRPLLEVLADPESIFLKGLAKFQRRTLYANIVNDRSAVYYTTGISKKDPYINMDKIKINYLTGYNDVILDPKNPVAPLDPNETSTTFYERFLRASQTTYGRLPFILAMVFFIPIGVVAFLINSGVQSVRSTRRIKLHERGLAGIEPGNYRVPLLISGVRGAVEDAYENINSSQSHEYLVDGTEEEEAQQEPSSPTLKSSPSRGRLANFHHHTSDKASDRPHDPPTLALADYQFRMVQALDNVGWRKYPVHIHKVRHSHAAIIVRVEKQSFDEGRVVLRHWIDEEFVL
ncbi:putative serine esterase-domain-containing protein [Amylocarpus encephaloides]|uniref:Serine esterase-domain-containing protein n=1 Tax=Amylocarpus encephaloides TaxID=45428 RepID=A0A9P7YJA0_9HELO|nr:putative serine esterase-domain-containing protein [Amylocarpus encephaloides]